MSKHSPPLAIGCDLGGTNLKLVLLDRGKRRGEAIVGVERESATSIVDQIASEVRSALGAVRGPRPVTLGVAVPGFLGTRRRTILRLSNLPGLDGYPLARRLELRLRSAGVKRVRLDTDTNAGALAEALKGAGKGLARVLYISLGTGVGAGLVVDGEVVRVSNHTVGQIAHWPLVRGGRRCRCGRRCCAEAQLSAAGILWRARRAGLSCSLGSCESVYRAASEGSSGALAVFREAGKELGQLAGMLGNFLSPDLIVIGGGLAGAADFLLPPAQAVFDRRSSLPHRVAIVGAAHERFAGAVGAALLGKL